MPVTPVNGSAPKNTNRSNNDNSNSANAASPGSSDNKEVMDTVGKMWAKHFAAAKKIAADRNEETIEEEGQYGDGDED